MNISEDESNLLEFASSVIPVQKTQFLPFKAILFPIIICLESVWFLKILLNQKE